MNRQDILGPRKLISMEATILEGEVFYPFGETPSGMIMYDSSGYMSYSFQLRWAEGGLTNWR
jgi:hypothetical protein